MKIIGIPISENEMSSIRGGALYGCNCVGGQYDGSFFVNEWSSWDDEAHFQATGDASCGTDASFTCSCVQNCTPE